ncbi:MAG: hypothetical protein RLO14_16620 [Marinobacter salarius]
MHENRSKSYIWNLGIPVRVTLLNCMAIIRVFNRMVSGADKTGWATYHD